MTTDLITTGQWVLRSCLTGYLRKTGIGQSGYLKLDKFPYFFSNSFKAQYSNMSS